MGAISKPNRLSLKMQKFSLVLSNCPCKDTTCRFVILCPSFMLLDLNAKIAFIKDQQLCRNFLIKHRKGDCKFVNCHTCDRQDANNKHHSLLCPQQSKAKVVAGAYIVEDTESGKLGPLLNVLESLDIECTGFFSEIPLHEVEEETDSSSDSSDSDSDGEYGHNFNGRILVSKVKSYFLGEEQNGTLVNDNSNTTESSTQTERDLIISLFCPNGEHSRCQLTQSEPAETAVDINENKDKSLFSRVQSYLWGGEQSDHDSDTSTDDDFGNIDSSSSPYGSTVCVS